MFKRAPGPLAETLSQLLALVNERQNPNINALWRIAKDIEGIKLNIKMFGYELARQLGTQLPAHDVLEPSIVGLRSKPSTQSDMEAAWVAYWSRRLGISVIYHRKIWELCYVLQALWEHGVLLEGSKGLGFGCGKEPIPSLLAAFGCQVTMTDLEPEQAQAKGWVGTQQHATQVDAGHHPHLVDATTFGQRVELQYVDMNDIPDTLRGYDFCWSICSFEHLGSIANGLRFVESSLKTLRPGGVAVHTTEFNFLNDASTIDNWPTVLFQRGHFVDLAQHLTAQGHSVCELDFDVGHGPMDRFVDLPPYGHDMTGALREIWAGPAPHLKLMLDGFASTCFGLIIKKGSAAA